MALVFPWDGDQSEGIMVAIRYCRIESPGKEQPAPACGPERRTQWERTWGSQSLKVRTGN